MKKRMSRILSILMAFALIVSAGDVVRAEDVEGSDVEVQVVAEDEVAVPEAEVPENEPEVTATPVEDKTAEPVAEDKKQAGDAVKTEETLDANIDISEVTDEGLDAIDMSGISKKLMGQESFITKPIPVKIAATGTETLPNSECATIGYDKDATVGGNYRGYSQVYNASAKGTLNLAVGIYADSAAKTVWYGVYKDAGLTQPLDASSEYFVSGVGNVTEHVFKIPSKGTYYIGVKSSWSSYYDEDTQMYVLAGAMFYNGEDRTISSGKQIAVGQKDAQVNYFAIKAASTGYIKAEGDNTAKYYKVALCDSKKKALSGETSLLNAPTYGVKAKTTYYLRVTSTGNSSGAYVFRATNAKVSEKSGKTKKKAVTIKKKKTKTGTIEAGSAGKQADWYKFKLTGKKKVTINVTTASNDTLKILVYKGGKKITSKSVSNNTKGKIYSLGKWPKGTYYIKIQRGNSVSSGYYTLKWS